MTFSSDFAYSGTELEAVAEARNYYDWIIDSFASRIGARTVEAGAGIGTVSEQILNRARPDELLLIEPDAQNAQALEKRFQNDDRVQVRHGYLEDVAPSLQVNSVIAVNVLEHVEHDSEFLAAARQALAPGGHVLLLVPALPAIFGSLDRAFDHYRRYTKTDLSRKLTAAGLEIENLYYLNMLGVAAWFASGRILHRTTLGRGQVRFYDRYVIPVLRQIESRFHPPIGQSILAIARKGVRS